MEDWCFWELFKVPGSANPFKKLGDMHEKQKIKCFFEIHEKKSDLLLDAASGSFVFPDF